MQMMTLSFLLKLEVDLVGNILAEQFFFTTYRRTLISGNFRCSPSEVLAYFSTIFAWGLLGSQDHYIHGPEVSLLCFQLAYQVSRMYG